MKLKFKRMLKLGMGLVLLLSLFMAVPNVVNAEGVTKAENDLSKELTKFEMSLVEEGDTINVDFTTEGNRTGFSQISLVLRDATSSSGTQENIFFNLSAQGNGRYIGTSTLTMITEGNYKINEIELRDTNGDLYKMSRECTASSVEDYCSMSSFLYDGHWDDYTIHGKKQEIQYTLPILKSISGSGFEDNIEVKDILKFGLEYIIENESEFAYTSITLFYEDENGKLLSTNLGVSNHQSEAYMDTNIKYISSKFKLVYVSVSASTEVNEYGNPTNITQSFYSNLSEDEFINKYHGGSPLGNDASYDNHTIINMRDFDFSISNYMDDQKAPILKNITWKHNVVSLPGGACLEYEFMDDGGSNLSRVEVLTDRENLFGDYNSFVDEKGQLEFSFGRYDDITPLKIYGLYMIDNAGNAVYYLENPNEVNTENGQKEYHGFLLDSNAEIKELPNKIDALTFKRTQDYKAIFDNSANFLDELNKAEEGDLYVLDTSQRTIIDKEVFASIKGKNVTLIFEKIKDYTNRFKGIQWVINGKDITNPKTIDTETKTIIKNMKVDGENIFGIGTIPGTLEENNLYFMKVINEDKTMSYYAEHMKQFDVKKDNFVEEYIKEFHKHEYVDFEFKPNGQLPGKTTIRFKMGYTYSNALPETGLNLFYMNGEGHDLVDDNINIDNEDYYGFEITHNSTYKLISKDSKVLSPNIPQENGKEEPKENVKKDSNINKVETGDNKNINAMMAPLIISGFTLVLMRKKAIHIRHK